MECPDCSALVKGNFCSCCGRQLPYVVGESFPYGLRFPEVSKRGAGFLSAANVAQQAPKYLEERRGGVVFHAAFFGLESLPRLVDLYRRLRKVYAGREELIEHSVDGVKFLADAPPWGCFASHVAKMPPGGMAVPHENVKCHSLWGCHFSQERQPRFHHVDGEEVFRHGVHGFFMCSGSDEDLFGQHWPPGLRERLLKTPFQMHTRKIRSEVMRLVKRYNGHRCPAFSAKYLDRNLAAIPDSLVVENNPLWELKELPGHWPGVALKCYQAKAILNLNQRLIGPGGVQLGKTEY